MGFTRFSSIRARLLALMLLILAPIAIISMVLAASTYRKVSHAIEVAELELASNYAVRTRVWFRGTLRMAIAAASTLDVEGRNEETCAAALRNMTSQINGLQAVALRFGDGAQCQHSTLPTLDGGTLRGVMDGQLARPPVQLWSGPELGQARYDAVRIGGKLHLVIFTRLEPSPGRTIDLQVLMDPRLLDLAFDIGVFSDNHIVALVRRGQDVLVARGADETERAWLPAVETMPGALTRTLEQGRDDVRHAYVSWLVAEPDIYVLARFDNGPAQAALTQFLVLALTPLVTLVLMFLAFLAAINRDLLRWINAIETTARERLAGGFQRADVSPEMPDELGRVAAAYNSLIDDVEARENDLKGSLERNMELMRELNHRVKNSLQVIQSYLALSRRQSRKTVATALLETEAKVLVLSSAYRLALREGTLQPVPVKPFVEEIVANLAAHLRGADQWIDVSVADDAFPLVVDRAIPLGLAIVEAVAAGLKADNCRLISVKIALDGEAAVLSVGCDRDIGRGAPPDRIMSGLAAQIEAEQLEPSKAAFLRWRLRA